MLCVDVNVLVDGFRQDSGRHEAVREWLLDRRTAGDFVIVHDAVAASFVRIVTNPRIWIRPTSSRDAQGFLAALLASPRFRMRHSTARQWRIFGELVEELGLGGDDVADAFIAAGALDAGATFVTGDRGFRRFPRLRVLDPAVR